MADDGYSFETASRKAKRTGKINIFDDDISMDAAHTIIKSSQLLDDDEEEEEINFDGTPVVKYSNTQGSTGGPPDLSLLAMPASSSSSASRTLSHPIPGPTSHSPAPVATSSSNASAMPGASSVTFGGASNAVNYGHTRSHSMTFGSTNSGSSNISLEKPLARPTFTSSPMSSTTSLQDIDEASGGPMRKQVSSSEIDKMQQEIQSLKRSLLSAKRDRWVKLPVDDTLRRIMKGEPYSLELYKSLEDKLALLDHAVQLHDGNAITMAVLFLQSTVTRTIFSRELAKRLVAADHYLTYLKAHFEFAEYINTLMLLGRTEEAAIFKYKLALPTQDVSMKISKLKDSIRSYFQSDQQLAQDTSLAQEYVDLLERQRPIDDSDANLEAAGKTPIFRDIPRKCSLIGMSVVTTLYYCCLYHFDLSENSLASPSAIRKRHQISDKQFVWTAVSARAKVRVWKDIENLLTTKGWFGGTKMKAVIGFDKVVEILHRNSAPPDILDKYLANMDDLEERIALAKKVSCHKAVIDALVASKNRPELQTYAATLDRYSKDGLYAFDILNTSTIKWK